MALENFFDVDFVLNFIKLLGEPVPLIRTLKNVGSIVELWIVLFMRQQRYVRIRLSRNGKNSCSEHSLDQRCDFSETRRPPPDVCD